MSPDTTQRTTLIVLFSGFVLYLLSRLVGPMLFDNDWSLVQWEYLPLWYVILWLAVTIGVGLFLTGKPGALSSMVATPKNRTIAGVVLFLLLFLFQFNSYVYAAGNLRVAQLTEYNSVILRWYEFGVVGIATLLFAVAKWISGLIGAPTELLQLTRASVWTWKAISFVCAGASIIAAWRISGLLTRDNGRRTLLFLVLFFGPQALVLFGFVGLQPVFVAVSLWFYYYALRSERQSRYLLHLWLAVIFGGLLHVTLLYLLPAAVYVSMKRLSANRKALGPAAIIGVLVWAVLLTAVYFVAGNNLQYIRYILFLHGKRPFADYGIFSLRHLGDLLQVLLMVFPAAFAAKYLVSRYFLRATLEERHVTAMLLTLGGITLVFIADPSMSILLDFPILAAFLTPVSLLAASLAATHAEREETAPASSLGLLAALSLMILLSYLPLHTRIGLADGYGQHYLDKNKSYYYAGGLAFRDAFFYVETGDKPRANDWEQRTRRESPVMLLMEGSQGLVTTGKYSDALNSLHRLSAEYPYLSEPREAIAQIEWSRKRFDKARIEVDSLRLFFPYKRSVRVVEYKFEMAQGNVLTAKEKVDSALALYPGDPEILVDKARVMVLLGDFQAADRQIKKALADHPDNTEAILVQARLAERLGDIDLAIASYERFIQLQPRDPDITSIRKHYNDLVLQKRDQQKH